MASNGSSADAQATFLNIRAYDIYSAIATVLTTAACLTAVGAIVRGRLWRKRPQHILTAAICLGALVYSNAHLLSTYLRVIATRQTLEPAVMLFSVLFKVGYTMKSFGLLSLSVDQFLSITKPFLYHPEVKHMCWYLLCIVCVCAVETAASLLIWDHYQPPSYAGIIPNAYHAVYDFHFMFAPVVVSLVLQGFNLVIAKRHMNRIQAEQNQEVRETKEQLKRMRTNISVLLVLLFSWIPTQMAVFMQATEVYTVGEIVVSDIARIVLITYCFLVPLIYAFRSRDIFQQFRC